MRLEPEVGDGRHRGVDGGGSTASTTKRMRSGGPMTWPSQALTPAMATERGVGGPGQGLADRRRPPGRSSHGGGRSSRCAGVRTISGSGGGSLGQRPVSAPARSWLPCLTWKTPFGQGEVGHGVDGGGQAVDLGLEGEARRGSPPAGQPRHAERVAQRRVGEHGRLQQGVAVDDVAALLERRAGAPPGRV